MSENQEDYKKKLKEYYDEKSAVYSATYTGEGRYPTGLQRQKIAIEMIDCIDPKPESILDAGCGDARMIIELSKIGLAARGFDLSDGMLNVGRKLLRENQLSESLIESGDVYKISSADSSHDLLLSLGVIENLDRHKELFEEFSRVLKPGGRILVSLENQLFSLFTFNKHTLRFLGDFFGKIGVPSDTSREVLKELGTLLNVDEVEYVSRIIGDDQIDREGVDLPVYHTLNIKSEMKKLGFELEKLRYYHVHPIPPRFENQFPEVFGDLALSLESAQETDYSALVCNCMLVQAVKI